MTHRAPLDYESDQDDTTGRLAPRVPRERRSLPYADRLSCILALLAFFGCVLTYSLEEGTLTPSRSSVIARAMWAPVAIAGFYFGEHARHFRGKRRRWGKLGMWANVGVILGMVIWWCAPALSFWLEFLRP